MVSEERRLEEGEGELIRDDVAFTPLHAEPNRTYPEGCASPHKTGTPIDAARCVVVDIDLNSNNLTGTLNVTEIGTDATAGNKSDKKQVLDAPPPSG